MIFNPNVTAAAGGGGGEIIQWTGDGTRTREIPLPFPSALLIVMKTSSSSTCHIAFISEKNATILECSSYLSGNMRCGMLSLNTSIDEAKLVMTTDTYPYLNSRNITYICIAIPKA